MAEDIDPELQGLLNDLDKVGGSVEAQTTPPVTTPPEAVLPTPAAAPASELPADEDFVEALKDHETDEDKEEAAPFVASPIAEEDPRIARVKDNVLKLLEGFVINSTTQLDEFQVDRKKCDDLYNILITKLQTGTYSGSDAVAVVQLLQAKADINSNRSRHLDSIAKLLVALKSNPVVGTDKGGSSSSTLSQEEVKRLLSSPD